MLDHDAGIKLAEWFKDRWKEKWCVDITKELIEVIEQSWAREDAVPPHHIYVKIAYHLAQEARAGLSEFRIPPEFGNMLFDYQTAAVKIAAHHLNKRGGVLIGDVVGLGKTLMATALAKIFEDDHGLSTLILCPKNLVKMWQGYADEYGLHVRVLSFSRVIKELRDVPARFRLVLIDESHNLRNRQGLRFKAIQEYIGESGAKVILLSATPYNKTYQDLSSQLRLFVAEDQELTIRPERLLKSLGETEFRRRYQASPRSLAAFEKSEFTDDWRELMRLYMVRRTRSFIQQNYASADCPGCAVPLSAGQAKCPKCGRVKLSADRKYLTFADGTRSYFPERVPKTVKFKIKEGDPNDQYARLYAPEVVAAINALSLPRYGLGNYVAATPHQAPAQADGKMLQDLSRAGKRLMGFCRTNLFKRLESSGQAFVQSLERHILRNYIFLHAIEHDLALPIGTQDSGLLDAGNYDEDVDDENADAEMFDDEGSGDTTPPLLLSFKTAADFKKRAAEVYARYSTQFKKRFRWLRPDLFVPALCKDLTDDSASLMKVLADCGAWDPARDAKLEALFNLLTKKHANEKVILFTQFADTVRYLDAQLRARGLKKISGVSGESPDPTGLAWRFSPESNRKRDTIPADQELRVLLATDVLSEGQNLQDAAVIVNFDLPWAIIRLIQRAGRVDRIGQKSDKILCYSFLPADGVDKIINLRGRVRQRLHENAEVVGTDEAFFEDEYEKQSLLALYHEKSGILDGDADNEVDLASYAYQIWKNATDRDPELLRLIPELPPVVYSTKPHQAAVGKPPGVLVYLRTAEGNDALAWVDGEGNNVTESQFEILRAAECAPGTLALPRHDQHHILVRNGVEHVVAEEKTVGGQLGRPSGARFRAYERLKRYAEQVKGTLFDLPQLAKAIEEIYRYPMRQSATDTLNRQLRAGIADEKLGELVMALRDDDRLCLIHDEEQGHEPQLICSLGLAPITP